MTAAIIETKRGRGRPRAIPDRPPAPRAPAVLEYLETSLAVLAEFELEIAEKALAAAEGRPGGKRDLAELHEKIQAANFEIACNAKAHALAMQLDREAVDSWKATVKAMRPTDLLAGLTPSSCARRCSTEHGCVITMGPCAHPVTSGALPVGLSADPVIRGIHTAALEILRGQRQ